MLKVAPATPWEQVRHSGPGGAVEVEGALTTCLISSALSCELSTPASTALRPSDATNAATPAWVGIPVEVEPSLLGTEKRACGPYEANEAREMNVELLAYQPGPLTGLPARLVQSPLPPLMAWSAWFQF